MGFREQDTAATAGGRRGSGVQPRREAARRLGRSREPGGCLEPGDASDRAIGSPSRRGNRRTATASSSAPTVRRSQTATAPTALCSGTSLRAARERLPAGPDHWVLSLAYSPDGTRLATVDALLPRQGESVGRLPSPALRIAVVRRAFRLVWLGDERRLLARREASRDRRRWRRHPARCPYGSTRTVDQDPGRLQRRACVLPRQHQARAARPRRGGDLGHRHRYPDRHRTARSLAASQEPGRSREPALYARRTPGRRQPQRSGHDLERQPRGLGHCGLRDRGRQLTRSEWSRFVSTQPYGRVCP